MNIKSHKDYGDTNFITGMRAFAAVAVLMIHAGGAGFRSLGVVGNNIADLGKCGVYVFFVISGFSVATSRIHSTGYFSYINKRLLRIAPLYYFWIFFSIVFSISEPYWREKLAVSVDAYDILMHLTFLSFLDYRIANSILGVEWSISIEVFWYFIIPFLIIFIKNPIGIVVSVILSLLIYLYSTTHSALLPVPNQDRDFALYWSPLPYIICYCLGAAAFRLRGFTGMPKNGGLLAFVFGLSLLIVRIFDKHIVEIILYDDIILFSAVTFLLILFGSSDISVYRIIFGNKIVLFIGTISYGIYLAHMPLLILFGKLGISLDHHLFVKFIVILSLAIFSSTLTYYLIEQPTLALRRYFQSTPSIF